MSPCKGLVDFKLVQWSYGHIGDKVMCIKHKETEKVRKHKLKTKFKQKKISSLSHHCICYWFIAPLLWELVIFYKTFDVTACFYVSECRSE